MEPHIPPIPDDPALLRETVLSLLSEKQKWSIDRAALEQRTELLTEQLRLLRAKLFGRSSEKKKPFEHPSLFNEAEQDAAEHPEEEPDAADQTEAEPAPDAASIEVAAHNRVKKGRKPLSPDLPREEVIHDLPEEQKVCDLDGHQLVEIGREISEQLEIVPAQVKVLQHVRIKYGCPHCRQGVHIAPVPLRPIPKALASASLLAYIAASKYADALPLYRLSHIFAERYGVSLSRTTFANWMILSGHLVQPLINLIRDRVLEYGYIQMDETTVQVLNEPGKPATSNSYMWVQRGGSPTERAVLFDYDASRKGQVPKDLLADYQGWLQTDGYDGYLAVGAQLGVEHLGCWAHVRRKFMEAVIGAGKGGKHSKAQQGVNKIAKLYAIEKRIRGQTPQQRFEVRQREVPPIFKEIREWMDELSPLVLASSLTGKALGYLHNQWDRLVRYIEDGRLEIDNNGAENAIRPFVLGRKNWLFSDTVRGAKASANLYSLIETAKTNGLEPFAYLRHVFERIPAAQTPEDFEALLPWKLTRDMQPKVNPSD